MPIQFRCAGCSQPIEVDNQFAGKSAQCPYCQRVITVPAETTLDAVPPIPARPAAGTGTPPPIPIAPPPFPGIGGTNLPESVATPRSLHADPREDSARGFGNFALIFVGLALALLIAQVIFSVAGLTSEMARLGTTNPTPEQMQGIMQKLAMEKPLLAAFGVGSLFFGMLGLILGAVSWRQWPASNWRAWLSMGVGGLFMLCICGAFAFTLITSAIG